MNNECKVGAIEVCPAFQSYVPVLYPCWLSANITKIGGKKTKSNMPYSVGRTLIRNHVRSHCKGTCQSANTPDSDSETNHTSMDNTPILSFYASLCVQSKVLCQVVRAVKLHHNKTSHWLLQRQLNT